MVNGQWAIRGGKSVNGGVLTAKKDCGLRISDCGFNRALIEVIFTDPGESQKIRNPQSKIYSVLPEIFRNISPRVAHPLKRGLPARIPASLACHHAMNTSQNQSVELSRCR